MGKIRRFSSSFVSAERKQLQEHRDKVRELRNAPPSVRLLYSRILRNSQMNEFNFNLESS